MTYVDVLRDKRQAVVAELEALRVDAASVASRIAVRESQLRNLDDLLALEEEPTVGPASRPESASTITRSQRFVDAAYETLVVAGAPLYYREIAKSLAASGVYIPGQDPAANLIAHMTRDARFARANGRGNYGLAEWPAVKAAIAARHKPSVRIRRSRQAAGA